MIDRLELQRALEDIIGEGRVYFQPPAQFKLSYPCIVYERDSIKTEFADNDPFAHNKKYSITVIDKNPESTLPDAVSELRLCSFSTHFVSDNLYHDVFTLYLER